MKQISIHNISEKLDAQRPEYRITLPEVTDVSRQETLRLAVELLGDEISELEVTLYPLRIARPEFFPCVRGRAAVMGRGLHHVEILLEQMDFGQMVRAFLNYLDGIAVKLTGGGAVILKGVETDTLGSLEVQIPRTSRAAGAGEWADYPVTLINKSDRKMLVNISRSLYGKECLPVEYAPYAVLEAHESGAYAVRVKMTEDVAPGGYEKSIFLFLPEGEKSEVKRAVFKTVREKKHPYLFLKEEQWLKRKAALSNDGRLYEAFRKAYVEAADAWEVPDPSESVDYVYPAYSQNPLFCAAAAWKITGEERYREKIRKFFDGFLDGEKGYLATEKSYFEFIEDASEYDRGDFKVCRAQSAGWVQEAEFFNKMAVVYDLLYHSFTSGQHRQIKQCFRNYMDFASWRITDGDGNNFQVAEAGTGLLCALVLQDQEMVDRFLYGYNGIMDLLSSILLDDGMYFEQASGYVRLAGELFFDIINAAENYGISLKDKKVPVSCDRNIIHAPWAMREMWAEDGKPFLGMSFQRFDFRRRTEISFRDFYDCTARLLTKQGILFSVNDSNEQDFTKLYQRAFYLYRDPLYRQIGGQAQYPEPLLAVEKIPEEMLPEKTAEEMPGRRSDLMEASGFGILRDGKAQAVLKFGLHGGYHGHYGRLSLGSFFQDGMTFHNNEYAWFGYDSFLFKMWVQTSVAHNMTVVDGRMQKPSPCQCVYYEDGSAGKEFRAVCAQTTTQWFDPPYGGQTPYPYVFPKEKCAMEGRFILTPEDPRSQGDIGEYSEPVFQRRLLILFHGYCILWDYLEGEQEHRYDCLYHPMGRLEQRGFTALRRAGAVKRERFLEDPFGAGQFIQNCYTAQMDGTLCLRFHEGQPRVNANDTMDHMRESAVWRAWLPAGEVTVGKYPQKEDTFTDENRKAAEGYLEEPLKKTVSFSVHGRRAEFITLLEGGGSAERIREVSCQNFHSIAVTEADGRGWTISADGMADRTAKVLVRVESRGN